MTLTNYYSYHRVNDYSSEGAVYDHKGVRIQQKTDLPIIVINWLNGQMINRECDSVPIEELNKIAGIAAATQKLNEQAMAPSEAERQRLDQEEADMDKVEEKVVSMSAVNKKAAKKKPKKKPKKKKK